MCWEKLTTQKGTNGVCVGERVGGERVLSIVVFFSIDCHGIVETILIYHHILQHGGKSCWMDSVN